MKKLLRKIHNFFHASKSTVFWRCRRRILWPKKWQKPLKSFYLRKTARILDRLNSSVPIRKNIKPFKTPHGLCGIFISSGAKIGKGCTIFQQVTIGSNTAVGSKKRGAPTIGERVYIGAGAKIIGGIKVGNDVRIGANCIVTDDIPDNSTVVMSKPHVITYDTPRDNTFISWDAYTAELKANKK